MHRASATFANRRSAGRDLADSIEILGLEVPRVIALPLGGVLVAAEVAERLQTPVEIAMVRRLPLPEEPSVGFGSVTLAGDVKVDHELACEAELTADGIARIARASRLLLEGWHGNLAGRTPDDLTGTDVVLIDDVVVGGHAMLAAIEMVRRLGARNVTAAVPGATAVAANRLESAADRLVCLVTENLAGLKPVDFYPDEPEPDEHVVLRRLELADKRRRR